MPVPDRRHLAGHPVLWRGRVTRDQDVILLGAYAILST
jgi:hypothetical protein